MTRIGPRDRPPLISSEERQKRYAAKKKRTALARQKQREAFREARDAEKELRRFKLWLE